MVRSFFTTHGNIASNTKAYSLFRDILSTYSGKCEVVMIPEGTKLPADLILIHEHGDHYSLQTTKPITPTDLNKTLTSFIKPFERLSKEDYYNRFPIS